MSIECYWDGNSGAVVYDKRSKTFTSKMIIPNVNYDVITYSDDDNTAMKGYNGQLLALTPDEIQAVKTFANTYAEDQPLQAADIVTHNSDPNAHPDMRQELSHVSSQADRVLYVGTFEYQLSSWGSIYFSTTPIVDSGINLGANGVVIPRSETYRLEARVCLSNIQGTIPSNATVTVTILKNNTTAIKNATFNLSTEKGIYVVSVPDAVLQEHDTIKVQISFSNFTGITGAYLPAFRNFLCIDNNTGEASNIASLYQRSLGNLMFYEGYELAIRPDDNNKPSAIAGTWTSTEITK